MNLKAIIEGLINSEDDTGLEGGCTVVDKKWVTKLKKYLGGLKKEDEQKHKAEMKLRDSIALYERRNAVADSLYSKADRATLGIAEDETVLESEGWETEGMNRMMQKFYYSNPASNEDSKIGTFIVDFKPKSVIVADVHSNT